MAPHCVLFNPKVNDCVVIPLGGGGGGGQSRQGRDRMKEDTVVAEQYAGMTKETYNRQF